MQHPFRRHRRSVRPVRITRSALSILALFSSLGLCCTGCMPDTEAGLQQFLDNTADARGQTGGTATPCPPCAFSGRYLMVVNTPIEDGSFLLFETTVTERGTGDERVVDITMQPLKTDVDLDNNPRPDPRTPVGDPLEVTDVPVTNGEFEADFGTVRVAPEANPLTGGLIEATFTLDGQVVSDERACGEVLGNVTIPLALSLDGSTFAAIRHDGDLTEVTEFPWSCGNIFGQADGADQ